eukprot:TRINITY_DN5206_c0_g1_i5.p1 TRINITY_DN5206_c0_g1~~TRINITY_DN5206_c0_g1_i5.p1  ORF type:complete len:145 (+),score=21.67 TRINITY_DN5206_c0_g1_i5:83-517(+)
MCIRDRTAPEPFNLSSSGQHRRVCRAVSSNQSANSLDKAEEKAARKEIVRQRLEEARMLLERKVIALSYFRKLQKEVRGRQYLRRRQKLTRSKSILNQCHKKKQGGKVTTSTILRTMNLQKISTSTSQKYYLTPSTQKITRRGT